MRDLTEQDLELLRLPRAYWNASVLQAPATVADRMVRYAAGIAEFARRPLGLYLHGPTGHGKTALAAALLKQARKVYLSGLFVSVPEHTESLRAKDYAARAFDIDTSVSERLREVDVLVLDGVRAVDLESPWFGVQAWEALIRGRNDRHRCTILTTLIPFRDFAVSYRGFAKAMEGTMVAVEVKGVDHREAAAARAVATLEGRK